MTVQLKLDTHRRREFRRYLGDLGDDALTENDIRGLASRSAENCSDAALLIARGVSLAPMGALRPPLWPCSTNEVASARAKPVGVSSSVRIWLRQDLAQGGEYALIFGPIGGLLGPDDVGQRRDLDGEAVELRVRGVASKIRIALSA